MSGNALPWLPWYHRDFLAATQGWTLLERGAYFMLLGAQWEMGPLPIEHRRLAGIIGVPLDELETVWPVVGGKFAVTEQGLVNERLEAHRRRQQEKSAKARQSARHRWGDVGRRDPGEESADTDTYPNAYANASEPHMRSQCSQSQSQSQSQKEEGGERAGARGVPAPHYTTMEFHRQVIAAYHEILSDLPPVKEWGERRRSKLNARIRERLQAGMPADTVLYWRGVWENVAASDFLSGRGNGREWRASLEWLLEKKHFTSLMEGAYDNRDSRRSEGLHRAG